MRVNLLANMHRTDAIDAARSTMRVLRERDIQVGADREVAAAIGAEPLPPDLIPHADLVISFGGDGTLIRAAHMCSQHGTPILGVFYGRFGFVTQVRPEELGAALSQFLDGEAPIQERMMLQTDLIRSDRVVATLHCLNEASLQRSATARMLTFDVHVDGKRIATYPADGVLVATPTGSTAYNLSAGGPVVDPKVAGMVLTAIMPHTLSSRSLVLGDDAEIELRVDTEGEAVLSCDGQSRLHLLGGDTVKVTRSPRSTKLVSIDESDFLEKLSVRLLWSQDPMRGGKL